MRNEEAALARMGAGAPGPIPAESPAEAGAGNGAARTMGANGASGGRKAGMKRGGALSAALRAEALKLKHAAPLRLAVIMALPLACLGAATGLNGSLSFSPWNYWYMLLMPVTIALATGCTANADARLKNRSLLGAGAPLGAQWWAKALCCLGLSLASNLIVLAVYFVGLLFSANADAGTLPAAALTMLAAALATTATSAWMIPAGLFLTMRAGLLAGIFAPLALQLAGGFAWSLVPFPQLFPPSATAVIPTAFLPVLPSGEPLAADMTLGGALAASGSLTWAGIALGAAAFAALAAAGAAWLKRSDEL